MGRKLTTNGRIKKLEHLQRDQILKECNYECAYDKTHKAHVVDHLFSRTHKSLFFYRDNLNPLCSGCHTQKSFGQGNVASKLFFDTRARIGEKRWNEMLRLLKTNCPDFRKIWYLEKVEECLRKRL